MGGTATKTDDRRVIGAQPGPQYQFLASQADIAIYGGAAFGGKTYALLLEAQRNVHVPRFGAVIFRRIRREITAEGAMWEDACDLYNASDPAPETRISDLSFRWPSGGSIKFAALEHEQDKESWKGAQITLLCFDQLETFTKSQFFYLLSRNRPVSEVRPYVRATCNPVPEQDITGGWLHRFIGWWIDAASGFPIPERSGVLRWFVTIDNDQVWSNTPEELRHKYGQDVDPISVTFIPSSPYDNIIGQQRDPTYIRKLKNLQMVDRERLLAGNWNVRERAGSFFRREWFGGLLEVAPTGTRRVRGWDLAATTEEENPNASATCGIRMIDNDRTMVIDDMVWLRGSPHEVRHLIRQTAEADGKTTHISLPQDPGQAGKDQKGDLARMLREFVVHFSPETGSKGMRASPLSAQTEAGNVKVVRAAWNDEFFHEFENFDGTKTCRSDRVDAASRAYQYLALKETKRARALGRRTIRL